MALIDWTLWGGPSNQRIGRILKIFQFSASVIGSLQGWVKAQPWDRLLYILPLLIISLCSGTCIFQSGTMGKSTPSQVMRVSQDPYHVRKVSHPCQVLYYKSWTIEGNNTNHHPRLARCTSIALDQRPKIIMAKQPPMRHLLLWKLYT